MSLVNTIQQVVRSNDPVYDTVTTAVVETIKVYDGLQVLARTFVDNTGEEQLLICLSGTIPVTIDGMTFFIPVDVWLRDFPASAPTIFVVPTTSMMLQQSDVVDANGRVSINPPFFYWRGSVEPASAIVMLLNDVSFAFGEMCPVVSKPLSMQSTPAPVPTAALTSTATPAYLIHNNHNNQNHGGDSDVYSQSSTSVSNHNSHRSQHDQREHDAERKRNREATERIKREAERTKHDIERKTLIATIEAKIASQLSTINTSATIRQLYDVNEKLRRKTSEIAKYRADCEAEIASLDTELSLLTTMQHDTEQTCATAERVGPNPDEILVTPNEIQEQMLEYLSEDCAIEDVLYSLFVGLREGHVELAVYMTRLRALLGRQFQVRSNLLRVTDEAKKAYET
eukprot:m.15894 g.15894  ORF g.15894 m.15894 type:complete len:398 (+) comp10778_c0_seq1:296-1489(+)